MKRSFKVKIKRVFHPQLCAEDHTIAYNRTMDMQDKLTVP